MKVLKFGGTSVGSAERIQKLKSLIVNNERKIVVLSAMSGTTNHLVEIANHYYAKQTEKAHNAVNVLEDKYKKEVTNLYQNTDYEKKCWEQLSQHFNILRNFEVNSFSADEERIILAQGELMSTFMTNLYLQQQGVKSILLPALEFMRKDHYDEPDMYHISALLKREVALYPDIDLFITQGYICRSFDGRIDNLKRGGSDYSASIIGAAIQAEEVQIWTDIDGFHNNDPRIVEKTYSIPVLSFDEAAELAYFGAKILHPNCVIPVQEAKIPLVIKNTMDPQACGTTITENTEGIGIKAVAAKDNIVAIKIKSGRMMIAYGFMRKVFEIFEHYKTSIDMITTSEVAVSLTIDDISSLKEIVEKLKKFGVVEVDYSMSIIAVVGNRISEDQKSVISIFSALQDIPLRMISFGGSRHNISLLVETTYKKAALDALNKIFKRNS